MTDDLSLYYFPSCPYCKRVLHAAEQLGVELQLRNTRTHPEHNRALVNARGRGTVPVLRIAAAPSAGPGGAGEDGEDTWMPESADIVRYLKQRFG